MHAAAGILSIAAAAMANAVRAVTTERGLDPRDFALFAYGGNGPLHISLVARELGVTRVVIPPAPAVFAAVGMLMADVRHDFVLTDIRALAHTSSRDLNEDYLKLEEAGRAALAKGGVAEADMQFIRFADMRYVGQEHSLTVQVPALSGSSGLQPLKDVFDGAHLERFSHAAPLEEAEVVTIKVSAVGLIPRPEWSVIPSGPLACDPAAGRGQRLITLDAVDGPALCEVYDRGGLKAGNRIDGPAAIEEGSTTTLLRRGDSLVVDAIGNLLVEIGEPR
jgi:N-methylhydantoinase A